jgi:phosphoribosylanthranilate isomerase
VFYPASPRNIAITQAVEIVKALPAFVSVVALFVDEQETNIRHILEQVPIDCLQFHGDESPEACRIYGKRYLKAVRMQGNTDVSELAKRYHDADGLLLDAYHPAAQGGTGNLFDWTLIPRQCELPVILAGGLDATNVAAAIEQVKPYALDVSSGVEAEKGIKDKDKIAAFISAVHQGDRKLI